MTAFAKMLLGGLAGTAIGAVLGLVGALLLAAPRSDGTFGMREILVGMPALALIGLLAGLWLARTV